MTTALKITILVDNPASWIVPYAHEIQARLSQEHQVKLCFSAAEVPEGDMLFLLGCTAIVPPGVLQRNKHNFVVHESDLPKGRGWSPIAWQVLEGKQSIPVALFEACAEADAGPVYVRDSIELDGTELLPEIREKQAHTTAEMICWLLAQWPDIEGCPQEGAPTYYRRRTFDDDRLDPDKTLAEQFDHLRILDNERYPGWFDFRGKRYLVKIYTKDNDR
jgi:methionyl-tRNA formyltransferase